MILLKGYKILREICFIVFSALLVFFGLATITHDSQMVGSIGKFIGNNNLKLFGCFAFWYPFLLLIPLYAIYKYHKKINLRFFEFLMGFLLLFIDILVIQGAIASSSNKGLISALVVSELIDMIGTVGVWVFIVMIFILSLVLIFEDRIANIIKQSFVVPSESIKNTIFSNERQKNIKTNNKPKHRAENSFIENESLNEYIKHAENISNLQSGVNNEVIDEDNLQSGINLKTVNAKPKKLKSVEHLNEVAENKKLLDQLEKGKIEKPKDFELPSLKFLNDPHKKIKGVDEAEIDQKIYDLLDKLRKFKIDGDVVRTYSGPVVTTFEFRPAAHIKVSKILTLQDDLAMALKAKTIRIQAPIPGKDVVGIEIPNHNIQTIYLKEILESDVFKQASSPLTIALGKDIVGQAFVTDLKKLPHLLIAGTTGSGKSVGINAMVLSLLFRNSPKTLRLIMIDPKMLEFSIYNDIPHLLTPVITQPKQAITALSNLVNEMERRYKLMAASRTKNIENYNEKISKENGEIIPYIVVIIDELADLMMTSGKDVEFYIGRLAQMARASGIHLIVATQRPSVDVVTGLIKANLPSRISFRVGSKIDSKVILDQMGADSLLGRGDMLFTPPSSPGLIRLHAPFTTEEEISKIVDFLKSQQDVVYDDKFLQESATGQLGENSSDSEYMELDELYEDAKNIVLNDEKTSISYLQRRLKIGYNRAASIIEQLEAMGVLSEVNSKGQREIIR